MGDVSVAVPSSVAVGRGVRRTPDLEEMDWRGTVRMCAIGAWSARAMVGLVAAYVVVFRRRVRLRRQSQEVLA
jgi:hypothetical protein